MARPPGNATYCFSAESGDGSSSDEPIIALAPFDWEAANGSWLAAALAGVDDWPSLVSVSSGLPPPPPSASGSSLVETLAGRCSAKGGGSEVSRVLGCSCKRGGEGGENECV